ncbi:MAG: hypothetical protein AAGF12_36100, partial [Myxococcota bacterium]
LYSVGVLVLFASFPRVLVRRVGWLLVTGGLAFLLDQTQLFPKGTVDFYPAMLAYFLMFVVVAPWQYLVSRRDPVDRAAYGWVLLAALTGMSTVVFAIMIPLFLGIEPFATQGFALTTYALTYLGVSLGVLKFRLFDLDRWWLRTWSWLLGGVFVVLCDLVLLSVFDLRADQSMLLAVAFVGWLYFPVRQWIWERLIRRDRHETRFDVAKVAAARDSLELRQGFEDALREMFSPLHVERHPTVIDQVQVGPLGASLLIPALGSGHIELHYRDSGRHLFRKTDVTQAARLLAVVQSVDRALRAHRVGQEEERDRIRRDLHDDMGASIIRIIHATKDTKVAALAKHTMRDLRNVLIALSPEPASVSDALADLRTELATLVQPESSMSWEVIGEADWELTGRQRANLVRTLREATTNALRHGDGGLEFRFDLSHERIQAIVRNPTFRPPDDRQAGFGLSNIAARIEELGGDIRLDDSGGRFELQIELPRSEASEGA